MSGEVLVQCMGGALYFKFSEVFVKYCKVQCCVYQVLSSAVQHLESAGSAVYIKYSQVQCSVCQVLAVQCIVCLVHGW